jgi:hypothetical protein
MNDPHRTSNRRERNAAIPTWFTMAATKLDTDAPIRALAAMFGHTPSARRDGSERRHHWGLPAPVRRVSPATNMGTVPLSVKPLIASCDLPCLTCNAAMALHGKVGQSQNQFR